MCTCISKKKSIFENIHFQFLEFIPSGKYFLKI